MLERELDRATFLTEAEHRRLSGPNELPSDIEDRKRLLFQFFSSVTSTISSQQQMNKSNALISAIMAYIEENFAKDLYLEKISEELDVSTKYLSRVFKERIGMNLTDYISHLRISKAKELLLQSDTSITDVGERVGIPNRTTFLRTFKRIEGLSPNDYRKQGRESI
ncbi:helix-turn-helix domain-containing protein [Paenibacillus sp. CC-CFT747]|nr:helix-turn-helix domain-containing protein [Paenibacillus sp. CC-CFT747]